MVSPGITGLLRNVLLNTSAAISRVSCAGLPLTAMPLAVAVILLVVLVKLPLTAAAGTLSVMEKVQLAPGARDPAVKFNVVVPLIEEPVPQILFIGRPLASRPASVVDKLLLKAIAVALVGA